MFLPLSQPVDGVGVPGVSVRLNLLQAGFLLSVSVFIPIDLLIYLLNL